MGLLPIESGLIAPRGRRKQGEVTLPRGPRMSAIEEMGPAGQREKRGREARLGWGDTRPRR